MKEKAKNSAPVLGIDIGGTTVKMGLFTRDPAPKLAARLSIPTRTEDEGSHVIPDTAEAAVRFAAENGYEMQDLAGVGIGVPGPVVTGSDGSQTVSIAVNLNWKNPSALQELFKEMTGASEVCVLNDANAAALGELYASSIDDGGDPASGGGSAVMVTLGTGVGGGVIVGGRVVPGAFGAGGEIGHMKVSPVHPLLGRLIEAGADLERTADLEYYVSATGITRMASAYLGVTDARTPLRDVAQGGRLTAKDVFDCAKAGDAASEEICGFFFDTLGRALACVASVVDPGVFIIGGGVSHAGDYLLDGVARSFREYAFHPSLGARFRLAGIGNDAGLLGAVVPLLDR